MRRSRRRASPKMTPPARRASSIVPSLRASAYPWMDVIGVRRSWDTDSRNWRSRPRDLSRLSAMAFTALANSAGSSRLPEGGSGRRVSRSPAAILRVASVASTSGRDRLRLSLTATNAAPTRVTAAASRNHLPAGPRGAKRPLLTTTMIVGAVEPSAVKVAAAQAFSPTRPLLLPVAASTSRSRSVTASPSGSSARTVTGIVRWVMTSSTPMSSTPNEVLNRCIRPLARGTCASAAMESPMTAARVVALFSRCSTVVS